MKDTHLTEEDFERLLSGEDEPRNRLVLHHLAICVSCYAAAGHILDLYTKGEIDGRLCTVDIALGKSRRDAPALFEARYDLPYDVALVALELSLAYQSTRRAEDVLRVIQGTLPILQVVSVEREGGEIDAVRLLWTVGRVAAGLGRIEEGIEALAKVRGGFASRGMGYDTALVSLELSFLYASQGRTEQVKNLARHMTPIFKAQDVHREALAALTLFRRAAEQERVTEEFAREVLSYLRKARNNPELKFESGIAM